MCKSTYTPGSRVSDSGKNITGTVANDPAMTAEYPGMVPVHWDNGDRSVASPSILAPAAFNVAAFEAVTRTKHNIPAGFHVDALAPGADITSGEASRSGFKAGFWELGPVVFDDTDGEPVMMRGRWNEHDGAHLVLSPVDEQYAIGIPAKAAQYVIEALQEVSLSLDVHDAVRDFQANYDARTLEDIERTAADLGIDLLVFAKLIIKPKDERAAAVKYLRTHPELATPQAMFSDLCRAADEAGLPRPAMAEAWGIVTGTTK